MNKNVFRGIVLIIVTMVTNGAKCSETPDGLLTHEKEVSDSTSYWNTIVNINNLDGYAEREASNIGRFNNTFFEQMERTIPEKSPFFSRVKALEPFYSTDQSTRKKAIKGACFKSLRDLGIIWIFTYVIVFFSLRDNRSK